MQLHVLDQNCLSDLFFGRAHPFLFRTQHKTAYSCGKTNITNTRQICVHRFSRENMTKKGYTHTFFVSLSLCEATKQNLHSFSKRTHRERLLVSEQNSKPPELCPARLDSQPETARVEMLDMDSLRSVRFGCRAVAHRQTHRHTQTHSLSRICHTETERRRRRRRQCGAGLQTRFSFARCSDAAAAAVIDVG